jgi:hypothetical protein
MKVQILPILLSLATTTIPDLQASTLCFVNALPCAEKIDFLYKGQKIRPFSFNEGSVTGCLDVPAGPLPFTVENPPKESVPLTANPESGKHKTAVVFEKSEMDPETNEIKKKHAILHVPQVGPPTGKTATFRVAYVGGISPLSFTIGTETFELEPNTFSDVKTAPLNHEVRTSESTKPWQIGFEEPAVYVLVIFRGNDGNLKHTIANESIY